MKRSICKLTSALVAVLFFGVGSSVFAQTATLKGKFVFDGEPPKRVELTCGPQGQINKDVATCCQVKHYDDSLVVNKEGEIANIVVYVRTRNLKAPKEILDAHKDPVVLDNKNCKFEPRVVGLMKGQKLVIGNSDNVGHNSNIAAQGFNPIVAAGLQVESEPKTVTLIPNEVTCNIHPWMKGWVVVRPDPFFAISAEDGTFEIQGLPAGQELEFQVWQEKSGFVTDVKLGKKATTWQRGRFTQKLKSGVDNDLGEIQVAAKNFNK
jgi:plastocyanin